MNDSGSSTDDNEPDRPLTPPSSQSFIRTDKEDSQHRIPAFQFEEVSLHAVHSSKAEKSPPIKTAVKQSTSANSTVSAASATAVSSGEFGIAKAAVVVEGSTTTRVRQRISRELIRETVQQRIAESSLNRKPSILEPTRPGTADKSVSAPKKAEKDLPPPPVDSIPMTKAHTTDAASASREVSDERPKMRPRSQTQSAHQVLKAIERDGVIVEPKSALDKLIQISGPSATRNVSTSSVITPVSILQKRKKTSLAPPVATLLPSATLRTPTPTDGGMAAREQAIIAKRREKEGRQASSTSGASGSSSKGRRRSLSVSDAGDGPEAVSLSRLHSTTRLTRSR